MKLRQANKIIKKSTASVLCNGVYLSVQICRYYYNKHQEDKALNVVLRHERKQDKKLQEFKNALLEEVKKRLENDYMSYEYEKTPSKKDME